MKELIFFLIHLEKSFVEREEKIKCTEFIIKMDWNVEDHVAGRDMPTKDIGRLHLEVE